MAAGQRDMDSDEMNEEMMDEHAPVDSNVVQPGWKISDAPSALKGKIEDEEESTEPSSVAAPS